jgi:protein dithiol:quinone oxidoreductase
MIPSIRHTNLIIFLSCLGLILVGTFYEHIMKYEPCPLCITQRAFFNVIGILAAIAFWHNPRTKGLTSYALLGVLAALGGGYFAQHQLWLQSLPADQVPACGPGLAYMFEAFPFMEAVKLLLQGDGSCAEPHKVLGVSFAAWSLMAFAGLGLINLWQLVRSLKNGAVST